MKVTRRTVLDSRELLTVVGESVRYESDGRSGQEYAQDEHRTVISVRGSTPTSNIQSLSTVGSAQSFSSTRMRERKVCRRRKLPRATRVHLIATTELFEQVSRNGIIDGDPRSHIHRRQTSPQFQGERGG